MDSAVVLVDFESIQEIDLSLLKDSRVVVFAGQVQKKIPIDLAIGLQSLGKRVSWVRSSGIGPNALDFHIAFELGRMVEKGERGPVFILSRDKGFDPLLTWMSANCNISARRVATVNDALTVSSPASPAIAHSQAVTHMPADTGTQAASLPAAKPTEFKNQPKTAGQPNSRLGNKRTTRPSAQLAQEILSRSPKVARPRRRATLVKHLHAMFKTHALTERDIEGIIAKLIADQSISDIEGVITYHF